MHDVNQTIIVSINISGLYNIENDCLAIATYDSIQL